MRRIVFDLYGVLVEGLGIAPLLGGALLFSVSSSPLAAGPQ